MPLGQARAQVPSVACQPQLCGVALFISSFFCLRERRGDSGNLPRSLLKSLCKVSKCFYNRSGRDFSSIYRACDSVIQGSQVFICYQIKKAVENNMPDRDSMDYRDLLKERTRHTENKSQSSMNMIKTGGK